MFAAVTSNYQIAYLYSLLQYAERS